MNYFPIGKTEIFYDSNDHSNYLGFTWERTALDRFIKGYSPSVNTIASTGGEKTHTLTINEMPSHNHILHGNAGFYTADTPDTRWNYRIEKGFCQNGYAHDLYENGSGSNDTGGDQPHNNEPQFQIFAIWRRVS